MTDEVQEITASAAVDHNLGAMFMRMNDIAKRIALISLLVSLPLLLMAGILLANLSNLLLLNERRKLGLLRLRGVSGGLIGRTLLLAIGIGGLIGGMRRRRTRHDPAAADLFRRNPATRSHPQDPGAALPRTVPGGGSCDRAADRARLHRGGHARIAARRLAPYVCFPDWLDAGPSGPIAVACVRYWAG